MSESSALDWNERFFFQTPRLGFQNTNLNNINQSADSQQYSAVSEAGERLSEDSVNFQTVLSC